MFLSNGQSFEIRNLVGQRLHDVSSCNMGTALFGGFAILAGSASSGWTVINVKHEVRYLMNLSVSKDGLTSSSDTSAVML